MWPPHGAVLYSPRERAEGTGRDTCTAPQVQGQRWDGIGTKHVQGGTSRMRRLLHPLILRRVPAAGLHPGSGMNQTLQLAEEALLRAPLVQDGVPKAADDAIVAFEGCLVMGPVGLAGHQDAGLLPIPTWTHMESALTHMESNLETFQSAAVKFLSNQSSVQSAVVNFLSNQSSVQSKAVKFLPNQNSKWSLHGS